MNVYKLSSEEVPQKFSEWLLAIGCPPEKVPNSDLAVQMNRGQYYMVWRSLIENVSPKDEVRSKRLLVFTDDIQQYRDKKDKVVLPNELAMWKEHGDLKQAADSTENQYRSSQKDMHQLLDKISSKLSQRNLARRNLADCQRRLNFLHRVSEELQSKKASLLETLTIANSLCCVENEEDAEGKLDKCIALVRRSPGRVVPEASTTLLSNVNSMSFSSTMSTSTELDTEEHLLSLVNCGGGRLWPLLCERRAALCPALNKNGVQHAANRPDVRTTPQCVLTHTSALHCTAALEAKKNRLHIAQTGKRLASTIASLCTYATGEACEHLVVCCERVRSQARVDAFKSLLHDLNRRRGMFETDGRHVAERHAARRMISNLDKSILSKKEELKRAMSSLRVTEKKIENIKECLEALFRSFHDRDKLNDMIRYGDQLPISQDCISNLIQFYEEKRDRRKTKYDISMELEVSDNSISNIGNGDDPRFINELKLYLDRFCLERNRKLVLESGEKIWIFETLQSSIERLHAQWQENEVTCSILCPSTNLCLNIKNVLDNVRIKLENSYILKEMEGRVRKVDRNIDITKIREEEKRTTDKIKKRLNDSLRGLTDTSRTLNVSFDNLQLWSKNDYRKYISTDRCVDGKTYKEYEKLYLEYINI